VEFIKLLIYKISIVMLDRAEILKKDGKIIRLQLIIQMIIVMSIHYIEHLESMELKIFSLK